MAHHKTFKETIREFLPLGYIRWKAKKHNFATGFKASGINSDDKIEFQESKYKNVVSVQGFNYSGSGAVIDMLREYPKFEVLGYVDDPEDSGGFTPKSMQYYEVDFIRLAGGLFEIEKYLDSDNHFLNDALLNRTANCFRASPLYLFNPEVRDLMYRFFAQIIDLSSENLPFVYYNPWVVGINEIPDIYYMKKMSKNEYYELARNFLTAVFNSFHQKGKDFLAADQLLADFEYKIDRNLEYIPNLKTILVPRDPRDTYAWALYKKQPHMEHTNVERFIKWYKHMYVNVEPWKEKEGFLITRYENLVLDYDAQEKRINDYLGLNLEDHKLRQQYFRPEFSKRFVGIYKDLKGHDEDLAIITEQLHDYCNPLID